MQKKIVWPGGFTVKWGEAKYFSVSNFATSKINAPFLVGVFAVCGLRLRCHKRIKNKIRNLDSLLAFPESHLTSPATP